MWRRAALPSRCARSRPPPTSSARCSRARWTTRCWWTAWRAISSAVAASREGWLASVGLTVAAVIGGLILGMGIALMRMSSNPLLSGFSRFYIWFFRGTPLLIQLVVIYSGLPQLGIKFSVITCALVGLILNE